MKRVKVLTKKFLVLILLFTLCVVTFTDETQAFADETEKFIDSEILDALIDSTLNELNTKHEDVSVALYYTGSGEYYYYNADRWIYSASLYKLPICMNYTHRIKTGECEADGFNVSDDAILEAVLVHSNGGWPMTLANNMFGNGSSGGYKQRMYVNECMRKQDLEYSKFDESQLPEDFFSKSNYSARFYLGILEELYNNSEEYPNVIEYMKKASPGMYLKNGIGEQYEVAQKYGSAKGTVAGAGFIFTPDPIIIVIMTSYKNDSSGNKVVGAVSKTITDYITSA